MTIKKKPNSMPNFKIALERFEAVEEELGLASWHVNDVYVWKILRFSMFRKFRQYLGIYQAPHPEMIRLRRGKFKLMLDLSKDLLFRNPFFIADRSAKRVIIPSSRKHYHRGEYVDLISRSIWHGNYEHDSVILDRINPLYSMYSLDYPSFDVIKLIGLLKGKTYRVRFRETDYQIVQFISEKLFDGGHLHELIHQVRSAVQRFLGLESVFKQFLKRTHSSYMYLVCSYGLEPIISAANSLGINVIEFQHGSIGRGHLGYDFKEWSYIPYFPNHILAFGTSWFEEVYFPKSCEINPVGYSILEERTDKAMSRVRRNYKQILVLSQGPIVDQILQHSASFAALRPDWSVIIRPHPSENADVLFRKMAMKASNSCNWRVEKEPSLAEHAAASSVVFGVNSTAIIEAAYAGCRVALLETSVSGGYFEALARERTAYSVKDGIELSEVVDVLPDCDVSGYFSTPVRDIVAYIEEAV